MANIVTMPKLGMTMTSGKITKWLKNEGERVAQGEPLLEIETDKVTMEEEASFSGVLLKILAKEGETVQVNQPIAIIGQQGENIEDLLKQSNVVEEQKEPQQKEAVEAKEPILEQQQTLKPTKPRATPVARKIAKEHGIDLTQIKGSGPSGRIQRKDVEEYLKNLQQRKLPTQEEPKSQPVSYTKTILLTGMRGIIADKMQKSMNIAPHYYVTMEINMEEVLKLRETLSEKVQNAKISINTFIIKAVALAIKKYPIINSFVDNDQIILKDQINIGLAVALEEGLIVPVIREADKKGLSEIAYEERQLIEKAREGKLTPDEYSGGSFTISNLGMFDVTRFTAIINQPEVAILAVGKIKDMPMVQNGQIEIKPIMEVTLSSDHRVIDGALAAKFLKRIKEILEDPLQLML
ncbi:pyruvate dehydrogenase E2 component (dihydrolipoamide acetyltransferase) [Thermoanaerobacter uzonensis DSM 18761]|uniref:Dihydrolipoamide acetyltransferase component of pyruvate dehydrogenase complex n=1 Tax=Thermoanaerobacter uzonensis DSM 18761 TaxID=1123369 RepID=A0A1M4XWD4_9THEO|nr:dihydrolipoamide acetyltransferase family protein [Thermoanaerobacter uzonensis]SHE97789.1 pyruvate dehydrogenase E2 component (dihydrolipoamide acetyltransferase) [Thermoanaerobacter uzonensis DSM 18761]